MTETQAAQTIAGTAGPIAAGTLSPTQASQTLSAGINAGAGSSLTVVQAYQTIAGGASIAVGGPCSVAQAPSALVGSAIVYTGTVLSALVGHDVLFAVGGPVSGLSTALQQGRQTVAAAAQTSVKGVLAGFLQEPQRLFASGPPSRFGIDSCNEVYVIPRNLTAFVGGPD